MKSFAIAAFVAVAAAQYEVAPPAHNSTSVEVPVYSTVVSSAGYSMKTEPASKPGYEATTVECHGPTEIPVGPSHTYTYTASEPTTLTFSYPVSEPAGEYTPVPVAPETPAYPTKVPEGPIYTHPIDKPSYPAGTGAPAPPAGTGAPPAGTGAYTPGQPQPSSPPEFPGAAGKAGLSIVAVAGALVAFL